MASVDDLQDAVDAGLEQSLKRQSVNVSATSRSVTFQNPLDLLKIRRQLTAEEQRAVGGAKARIVLRSAFE